MFYFVCLDRESTVPCRQAPCDRRRLLADLCREVVATLGYEVAMLEARGPDEAYTLTGVDRETGAKLIGEARAQPGSVDSDAVRAFVGSLDIHDDTTMGLLLSVSPLTPEARAFLQALRPPKRERVRWWVGEQIMEVLAEARGAVTPAAIRARAQTHFAAQPGTTDIVVSDQGYFYVQLLMSAAELRPSRFCVYTLVGDLVQDAAWIARLQACLPYLKELASALQRPDGVRSLLARAAPPGPAAGAGWFDAGAPAAPQYFVGHRDALREAQAWLARRAQGARGRRVLQVLGRTGIGKSSFLLKCRALQPPQAPGVISDARDLHSAGDVAGMLRAFVAQGQAAQRELPGDTEQLLAAVRDIDTRLAADGQAGVLFIDQFEALFERPELYAQVLSLMVEITQSTSNIAVCIARRTKAGADARQRPDGAPAALDEISDAVTLTPFTRAEALELLRPLSQTLDQPLHRPLQEMLLELSYGFPWLYKRLCAHVIDRVRQGSDQAALVQQGIRPADLLAAELRRVGEDDRAALAQLVPYLPATLAELSDLFPAAGLAQKLARLQQAQLVRLTGRTYDVAYGVLKHYLLTGRAPAIRYLFRSPSRATFGLLARIIDHRWETVDEIADAQRTGRSGIQAKLRELELLGLIRTGGPTLVIPAETLNAYHADRLAALIRSRVLENGLVTAVLDTIARQRGGLAPEALPEVLQQAMPILELSAEDWDAYAALMADWLRNLEFVTLSGDRLLPSRPPPYLSNRELVQSAAFLPSDSFLPASYMSGQIMLMETLGHGEMTRADLEGRPLTRAYEEINDALRVGLVQETPGGLSLTAAGLVFLEQQELRGPVLKQLLLRFESVRRYLALCEDQWQDQIEVLRRALQISPEREPDYTDQTWEWRARTMANWLEFAGLVTRTDGLVLRSRQPTLWENAGLDPRD